MTKGILVGKIFVEKKHILYFIDEFVRLRESGYHKDTVTHQTYIKISIHCHVKHIPFSLNSYEFE